MTKYFKVVFLAISLLTSTVYAAEVKEVKFVCEDKETYPDVLGEGSQLDMKKPGVAVETLKMLEGKLGIKVSFVRMPWKRALESELKAGTVDGAFTASYKKEREEFGVYPKTKDGKLDEDRRYGTTAFYFYKLKKANLEWDGKMLKNLKGNIGGTFGYSIVDDLKKMGYGVETSPASLNDMKKIVAGRIDICAALESEGDNLLKKTPEFSAAIEKMEPPIVTKGYYIMLSKQFVEKNPILSEKIWDAIKEIREKNMSEIMDKYY